MRIVLPLVVCALGALGNAQEPVAAGARAREDEPAKPQSGVGQTIVTARKLEEELVDVPRSISVVGSDTLQDAGIRTMQEASIYVPNLRLTEFSSRRLSFPFVRGVGSGLGEPSVITYIDGVPQFGTGGTNLPLLDVERVEFQRGAQGTLYGRNAMGGLISVVSRRPSTTPRYGAAVTVGDHALREYELSASGPIGDGGTAFSVAGLFSERDGYTTNDFTGNDVDDRRGYFGRGQLLFHPSDDSEARLSLFGEYARDGGFVLSDLDGLRANPHHINQDFEGVAERDVISPTLVWDRFGDDVDFKSITAYESWEVLETSDFDFTPLDGLRRRVEEEQDYVYQELRFASAPDESVSFGGDCEMSWQLGVSGFYSDSQLSAANEIRPGFVPPAPSAGIDRSVGDFEDLAFAVYGQSTLTFDERVDLTLGLRYDVESKEADLTQTFEAGGMVFPVGSGSFDETFDEVLPSVSAAYHFDEGLQTYVLAAKGFKAGGFNLAAPTAGEIIFGPEESWTYEWGVRKAWDEERHMVSAAAFYVDWDDRQLTRFDPSAGGYVVNAGGADSTGVEVEGRGRVAEGLDLFAGGGLLSTDVDATGNDLPFAPDSTWHLGAQYARELGGGRVYVRGEYADTGDFFYDEGNLEKESFGLANFRIGYQAERWRLDVWVRNAFDEEYVPIAFQSNPLLNPTAFVGESGAPRTFGVTLSGGI